MPYLLGPMGGDGAILIPFGVPTRFKGRGLGLASLVQRSARGAPIAVAQLLAKPTEERGPEIVETLLPPTDWTTLRGKGDAPLRARWVITGSLRPPEEEAGEIRLFAYDALTEQPRSAISRWIEEDTAAVDLREAFEELFGEAELGATGLSELGEMSWETLDLVLLGEASQTPNPLHGGARDPLGALLCLERALSSRAGSTYLAARIAALAGAIGLSEDPRGAAIAERALSRALSDAPDSAELRESLSVLALEQRNFPVSEKHALDVIALEPGRTRAYAILASARRRGRDFAGAGAALSRGFAFASDPWLLHERAELHRDEGRTLEARAAWEAAMLHRPLFEPAFERFAEYALTLADPVLASQLVDRVLDAPEATPSTLKAALRLLDAFEPASLARSAKEKRLAERWIDRIPGDPLAHVALSRAEAGLGNDGSARASLARAVQLDPSLGKTDAEANGEASGKEQEKAGGSIRRLLTRLRGKGR